MTKHTQEIRTVFWHIISTFSRTLTICKLQMIASGTCETMVDFLLAILLNKVAFDDIITLLYDAFFY